MKDNYIIMNELFKIVLSLSLSGTLLLFIIRALKPLYKHRISKIWQYYVLLIVIVRMLIPYTSGTTFVGSAFNYLENINTETVQMSSTSEFVHNEPDEELKEQKLSIAETLLLSIKAILSKVYGNLWIIWAAAAFALLIRKITMYQSFVRFVKTGRLEVSDIEILNMLADIGENIGVKRPVELFVNPIISSPMLLGFFRPCIILPSIELDNTELVYTIRHELTHYKYFDMFYKWLVQITICLHWFNPFVYLMAKEVSKCCELSCDEIIIRTLDKYEKKAYGDTLINSLKKLGFYSDKTSSVMLAEGAEQLKERLDAIMKFKKKSKTMIAVTLVLTAVLCAGAAASGAYAAVSDTYTALPDMEKKSFPSVYFQKTYYQEPYIFEIGWNMSNKRFKTYLYNTEITLSDLSSVTVSFDKLCKEKIENQGVLPSLTKLIDRIKANETATNLPLEKPFVVSIEYVGNMESMSNDELNKLARDYYKNDKLSNFSVIFSALDSESQEKYFNTFYENNEIDFFVENIKSINSKLVNIYAQKAYEEDNVSYFSITVPYLTDEAGRIYVQKTYEENNINYFSIIVPYLTDEEKQIYAQKAYEENNINYFSVMAPHLSDKQRQAWVIKASNDNKNTFLAVLTK